MSEYTPNEPLISLRAYLGATQLEFANQIGIKSHAPIARAEAGRHALGIIILTRILDRYRPDMAEAGVNLEDLMRGRFVRQGKARRGRR